MRNKNQVVLPIDLEICIPEEDFVFKVAEICESPDYSELYATNEYFSHRGKFGNRNSYSKTDIDATFMHIKEDHMRNGQFKPGYHIPIGVESEYIVGVGAFSNRNDVDSLIPFLKRIKSHTRRLFERIAADALTKVNVVVQKRILCNPF